MYKFGNVTGNNKIDLANNIIEYLGLKLNNDNDINIGKRVKFKNPSCEMEKYIYIIICKQKCYGYDENGNYTLINGYRGIPENNKNDFGRPFTLNDIYFID